MKDMHAHLEKLRARIAECELIRDLATDKTKRDLFAKLADHHLYWRQKSSARLPRPSWLKITSVGAQLTSPSGPAATFVA